MTKEHEPNYAARHSIVDQLFIVTADNNYVLARWSFLNCLDADFFWLAVHSLEKYLKASLLLNGKSAKGFKHDITKLYKEVRSLAPELLPITLSKPFGFEWDFWRDEAVELFIDRLYRDGQADNRYQLYGYVRRGDDLFKLDQLVFAVRRLCQPLEVHFLGGAQPDVPNVSRRERMRNNAAAFVKLGSRLESIISGESEPHLTQVALDNNFPFAPISHHHSQIPYRSSFQNPVLVRRLFGPLECGPEYFAEADELWKWVRENIQLPKGLVKEIDQERTKLKDRSGGSDAQTVSI